MKNKQYLNNKIKQKVLLATQKLKEEAQNFDYGEDVKEIFAKMRESLKNLRKEMINNIQKRIENNIAQVRAELYHTKTIWEEFEKEYLQSWDLTSLNHSERRDKVTIPKSFKVQNLLDKKTRSDIEKYYETLAPNAKMENIRNLSICTIYFKDLMASIRHRFGDISKFEELDYLSK